MKIRKLLTPDMASKNDARHERKKERKKETFIETE